MTTQSDQSYFTWDDSTKASVFEGRTRASAGKVGRARSSNLYHNYSSPNISLRDGFRRSDWEQFRQGEELPQKPEDVLRACFGAYEDVEIVRNIIDLMSDFATQGIDTSHPRESTELFYKEWFRRVGGKERSNSFLNLFFCGGNNIIRRHTALLPRFDEVTTRRLEGKAEIPWKYVFHHPLSVKVLGEELVPLLGQDALRFALVIPSNILSRLRKPGEDEAYLLDLLPEEWKGKLLKGEGLLLLDPEKTRYFGYKRKDWQVWASPMLKPLLRDFHMLEKMKLADLAALDGAISCIRVWKLGSLEHKIIPGTPVIDHLSEILCNNVGGGVMDLVWGPDIELIETSTEVHRFLGSDKYGSVLGLIYAGLGIPPTLTGTQTSGSFTNNYISLKTLTERLQYGRDRLIEFWEEEIRLVQKAMGFQRPATLVFDRMALSDEASLKQLLINLADRDLISMESLQEQFGLTPEIEEMRLRREKKKRDDGFLPEKASPFHKPQQDFELEKLFVQTGVVTPSEVGLELEDRKPGEKPMLLQRVNSPTGTPKGQPGQGRPPGKKDSGPRKQKTVQPRVSAFLTLIAKTEQISEDISRLITPAYLHVKGRKNQRQLTTAETAELEELKFALLCACEKSPTSQELIPILKNPPPVPPHARALVTATLKKHRDTLGELTLDHERSYKIRAVALLRCDTLPEVSRTTEEPAEESGAAPEGDRTLPTDPALGQAPAGDAAPDETAA